MAERNDSRTRLLDATTSLLADRGYHGTGMKDILGASGVVAGSLYHHFPGGKDELATACVSRVGEQVGARMDAALDTRTMIEAVDAFYANAAAILLASDYRTGCPVGTPAAETVTLSPPVAAAVADAFRRWTDSLARGLMKRGWLPADATRTASVMLSLYQGAVLVARAERNTTPLDIAAQHTREIITRGPADG
jgi:TetR/AcrR family transcriptional repressor of lmrAB and yxaGH operons